MEPVDSQRNAIEAFEPPTVAAKPVPEAIPTSAPPGTSAPPSRRKKSYWRWYSAAALVAVAVTAGAIASTSSDSLPNAATAIAVAQPQSAAQDVTQGTVAAPAEAPDVEDSALGQIEVPAMLLDASAVGRNVVPSVVTVQIRGTAGDGTERTLGSGSGVIYDDLGHIITNDHVVAAGTSFEIVLSNGRVYPAELVGTDPTTDLAVLSVTATGLEAIELGDSDVLVVGDPAVAVGSPLGLAGGPSLTVGVISAFGRLVRTDATTSLFGMLQTDAPITSGSSGGALVDGSGQLIGITTAVGVSDVGVEGIGFATPVEVVVRVADEIIDAGAASSPFLGIEGETSFIDTADGGSEPTGVFIRVVDTGTAAAAAGLEVGDVISAIDGQPLRTMNELVAMLRRFGAGNTIEITLDGGTMVDVTLGQRPGV